MNDYLNQDEEDTYPRSSGSAHTAAVMGLFGTQMESKRNDRAASPPLM